jgi:hypothetical protein
MPRRHRVDGFCYLGCPEWTKLSNANFFLTAEVVEEGTAVA